MGKVGFVLVAGGLGERLGSSQIKISLTAEIISNMSFFDIFLSYFQKFSSITGKKVQFFIMTSDDTDEKTKQFLATKNYADFVDIHIEKQDNVPSFTDFDLNIALTPDHKLQRKPHGHGDVHFLIKRPQILEKWKKEFGIEYVYFFQDTNPFSLPCMPIVLSYSIRADMHFCFLSVGRKEGEAIGALITDKKGLTYNIEYAILQNLLKSAEVPEKFDSSNYSNYSGNTNCFLIQLDEYQRILNSETSLKEFVNPKINKETGAISSPFRIESLMQDIVFSIQKPEKIGVVELNRSLAFTTCKNNLESGKKLQEKQLASETIIECENDIYYRNFKLLKYCGIEFVQNTRKISNEEEFSKQKNVLLSNLYVKYTPKLLILPSFGMFIKEIKENMVNIKIDLTQDLAIFLKGKLSFENCYFSSLSLWIENKSNEKVSFKSLRLSDEEDRVIKYKKLSEDAGAAADPSMRMRGYQIDDETKWSKIIID